MASLSSSDLGSSISSSASFRRGSRGHRSSLAQELSVQVDDAVNKSNKDRLKRAKSDVPLARPLLTGLKLHGREEDLRVVSGVVEGMFSADEATEKPLLMVAGSSGCGKSALVTEGEINCLIYEYIHAPTLDPQRCSHDFPGQESAT